MTDGAVRISERARWIGTLDPNLRIFDIVMWAGSGTSYNAYLVKGSKGCALIDTAKATYTGPFLDALENALEGYPLLAIVCNHLEPDHSGSLRAVMDAYPEVPVRLSRPGRAFASRLTHREDRLVPVAEGEELDLGGATLRFHLAPNLHWPDSIFTYLVEDRVLFTCDFLGSHFADPRLFDDEVADFTREFEYYFGGIFRPFKSFALTAVDWIAALDPAVVAPSHGPVLRTDPRRYLDRYRAWSTTKPADTAVVPYTSAYGNTAALAREIGRGLADGGLIPVLTDIGGGSGIDLSGVVEESRALVIGAVTINGDAVKPVWDLLASMITIRRKGKIAAAFGSYGWSGEGPVMVSQRLAGLGFSVPADPFRVVLSPTPDDLAKAREFGRTVASAAAGGR